MSAPFTRRRRAERFADAVDGGLLSADDPRLERLLETVGTLRAVARTAPEPRPAFVSGLRERLMLEADTALVPAEDRLLLTRPTRRPARLVAASAALVIAGGTAGMAVAAQDSLPGQSLYTLKQGLETAGRTLQLNQADRGRVELGQASTRLSEAQELSRRGDTDRVPATLQRFSSSAGTGADQLFTAYQSDSDPAEVTAVRSFAAHAMTSLSSLATQLPDADRSELLRAVEQVRSIDQEARVLCPSCGSPDALSTPVTLTVAPATLDLPPAAQSAVQQAESASLPRRTHGAVKQQTAAAAGQAAAGPSAPKPSSAAPAVPVKKAAGSASVAVKNVVPGGVGSAVAGVGNQVANAVNGAVDAAVAPVKGVVDGTVKGVGGLLGSTPTPK